ncbi:diacylglycerol kinase family protein [Planomonospora algeriensis]
MAELLAICNRRAGSADEGALEAALGTLREGADVVEAAGDGLDEALGAHPGRDVVVLGGDGSLHAAVAALHRRDELGARTVGLVPLGTGNDFAARSGSLRPGPRPAWCSPGTAVRWTCWWTTTEGSSSTPPTSARERRPRSGRRRSSRCSGSWPTPSAGCSRACGAGGGGCG